MTLGFRGKRVLVLGGTHYFGRRLVRSLVDADAQVTILTRGITADPFGASVARIRVDRTRRSRLLEALSDRGEWDFVFDQSCYAPDDAEAAAAALEGRAGRYVLTSSMAVYPQDLEGRLAETCFDPRACPLRRGSAKVFDYREGKRQAEAFFFQKTRLDVVAVRFPIVLGPDDDSGRLEFHISRVLDGKPMVIPDAAEPCALVSSKEAAAFLAWAALSDHVGPINAASVEQPSIARLLALVEAATARRARLRAHGNARQASPFANPRRRTLDQSLASELGFRFEAVESWLAPLIADKAAHLSQKPRWLPGSVARRLGWG